MPNTATSLVDLASETNKIIMEAITANYRRQLAYSKNVWGIVARPYAGNDLKVNVTESIERAEKVVDLTMADLETSTKSTIELADKVIAQANKAREESLEVARTYAKNGVKTIKHALETTEERLDTLSKRLEVSLDEVVAAPKKAAKAS
jgi:hypothetical protein